MIQSFSCKETEKIFNRYFSKQLPHDIQKIAFRKLRMLNRATSLQDLKVSPSNHLEALKGSLKGQYSIRINDQWRICFIWDNGDANNVKIVDYH